MRDFPEISAVSTAPTQSSRDSNTISIPDNSATRESNPGIQYKDHSRDHYRDHD